MASHNLDWQSKLVLLLVLPYTAVSVFIQARAWAVNEPAVDLWTLGLSGLLGFVAWRLRTATSAAALAGAVISAALMFSMCVFPYHPLRTGLAPVLAVLVLTSIATRFGRRRKQRLGTAEKPHGRGAAQVAANLGLAALVMDPAVQLRLLNARWFPPAAALPVFAIGLAALSEAAADTVSSEIGQVLGGTPRIITTLHRVPAGTDGAVSLAGTAAGILAAVIVSATGCFALHGGLTLLLIGSAAGTFGLFFDSLLGATVERAGWLNNDAVNFLSTAGAAGFALFLRTFAQSG